MRMASPTSITSASKIAVSVDVVELSPLPKPPSQAKGATTASAQPNAAPSVWREITEDDGRSYYHNSLTGQTSWSLPGAGQSQKDKTFEEASTIVDEADGQKDESFIGEMRTLGAIIVTTASHPMSWPFQLLWSLIWRGACISCTLGLLTALFHVALPLWVAHPGEYRHTQSVAVIVAHQALGLLNSALFICGVFFSLVGLPFWDSGVLRGNLRTIFWGGIVAPWSVCHVVFLVYEGLQYVVVDESSTTLATLANILFVGSGICVASTITSVAVGARIFGRRIQLPGFLPALLTLVAAIGLYIVVAVFLPPLGITSERVLVLVSQQASGRTKFLISAALPFFVVAPLEFLTRQYGKRIGKSTGNMMQSTFSGVYFMSLLLGLVQRFVASSQPTIQGVVGVVAMSSAQELVLRLSLPLQEKLADRVFKRVATRPKKSKQDAILDREFLASVLIAKAIAEQVSILLGATLVSIMVGDPYNAGRLEFMLGQKPGVPLGGSRMWHWPVAVLVMFFFECVVDGICFKVECDNYALPVERVWSRRHTPFVLLNIVTTIPTVLLFLYSFTRYNIGNTECATGKEDFSQPFFHGNFCAIECVQNASTRLLESGETPSLRLEELMFMCAPLRV